MLEVKRLKTLEFEEHSRSFIVEETQQPHVLAVTSDMFDHHLYGLYFPSIVTNHISVNTKRHIVMKYKICYSK